MSSDDRQLPTPDNGWGDDGPEDRTDVQPTVDPEVAGPADAVDSTDSAGPTDPEAAGAAEITTDLAAVPGSDSDDVSSWRTDDLGSAPEAAPGWQDPVAEHVTDSDWYDETSVDGEHAAAHATTDPAADAAAADASAADTTATDPNADRNADPAAATPPLLPGVRRRRNLKRVLVGAGAALVLTVGTVVAVTAANADSSPRPVAAAAAEGGALVAGPGHKGGRGDGWQRELRGALHGEFVTQAPDGTLTTKRAQTGVVTTLADGTLTVTSTDDFVGTYSVPADLDLTGIAVGDTVVVLATVDGSTVTATIVREPGSGSGNGQGPGKGPRGNQPGQAPQSGGPGAPSGAPTAPGSELPGSDALPAPPSSAPTSPAPTTTGTA